MPAFIALDLGTAFIKGAVLDPDGLRLTHLQRLPFPEPLPNLPPLFCEIDPSQIVEAVRTLIGQLLPHAPDCAGLVMCGQMGGLVLVTEQGQPLSNYISWRDQRLLLPHPSGAGTYFDVMVQRLSPADRRQLGNEVRPGLPVSFLFWLAEQQRLPYAGAIAATLTDFVFAHLCGSPPGIEITQATGALNLETLDWHYAVFAKLGLEQVRWPTLSNLREPVSHLKIGELSLPCYAPVGDHQCALAGAFMGYAELSLNISTGSQASLLTPRFDPGDYQTRPFFDGRFLNTITHIPAGRSLNVLFDLLCELARVQGAERDGLWSYITQAASTTSDTDLKVNLAFFPGPVGNHGAIANIREGNLTVGQLFYAAFRNMADNYYACALRLSPDKDWQTLIFSGGLAQKFDLLRQMILDRFQCNYRMCASTEDTLLGLLAFALVISGRASTVETAVEILRTHKQQFI
jgi:sugar (pentulose or hexulose) kinase